MKPFLLLLLLILALTACSSAPEAIPTLNPTPVSNPAANSTIAATSIVAAPIARATDALTPVASPVGGMTPPMTGKGIAISVSNALYSVSRVKSFRAAASIITDQGTIAKTIEYLSPDRFHEITQGGGMTNELTIIGNTTYQRASGGAWQKYNAQMANSPLIAFGVLTGVDDLARFQSMANSFVLVGNETLDGVPSIVYQYTLASPFEQNASATQKLWVGAEDNLPRRLQSSSKSGGSSITITVDYRDYDSSEIKINPPS